MAAHSAVGELLDPFSFAPPTGQDMVAGPGLVGRTRGAFPRFRRDHGLDFRGDAAAPHATVPVSVAGADA